jgi:hypothetical protein
VPGLTLDMRQMSAVSAQTAMLNYAGWSGRSLDRIWDCRTIGKEAIV